MVRAGKFRCGIPVGRVREVVPSGRMAAIPDGKPPFAGLVSVRGEIVTVIGLAELESMAASAGRPGAQDTTGATTGSIRPERVPSVVVLRGGPDTLGLEVEGVEDIRDFASAGGGAAGPEGSEAPAAGRLWAGVVRDGKGEVGVLDADAVFRLAEEFSMGGTEPEALEVGEGG